MSEPVPNPYQPPVARVADPPRFDGSPRPREVTLAVWLLWAMIAIESLDKMLDVKNEWQLGSLVVVATAVTMVVVGVMCWLIFMIGRRRNWSRITYAILFALGTIMHASNWQYLLEGSPRDVFSIIPQFGLQLAAMILLFRRDANAWFRSVASA